MANIRKRAWAFTVDNYSEEDYETLKSKFAERSVYSVIGREIAPTTGTPHLQGYVYFKTALTLSALKKLTGITKMHLEAAGGTAEQNRTYCTKEDKEAWEFGEIPHAGKRNDINRVREIIKSGGGITDVLEEVHSYQAAKFAELYLINRPPEEREPPEVFWFWGPTGTGKTRQAMEMVREKNNFWISGETLQWWQGYTGQEDVIIDDFRGDMCRMHTLLRYLDRYPVQVPIKGSSCWLRAKRIIITSCYKPEDVYAKETERIDQLLRRITNVVEFKKITQ